MDRRVERSAYCVDRLSDTQYALQNSSKKNTLLIGYGNPLRGDDGVGWVMAERLMGVEGITAVSAHQLLPELIDQIAEVDHVIFVDATVQGKPGDIGVREIFPDTMGLATSHGMEPVVLLAYVEQLYGRSLQAHLVTITGQDFGYKENLSPLLAGKLKELQEKIYALI